MVFGAIARKVFGTPADRRVKGYQPKVDAINALEAELEALSDDELRAKTDEFRDRYKNCLLYTSPSPRDRQKSRMPSSA